MKNYKLFFVNYNSAQYYIQMKIKIKLRLHKVKLI